MPSSKDPVHITFSLTMAHKNDERQSLETAACGLVKSTSNLLVRWLVACCNHFSGIVVFGNDEREFAGAFSSQCTFVLTYS